jgi:hypothetical protein
MTITHQYVIHTPVMLWFWPVISLMIMLLENQNRGRDLIDWMGENELNFLRKPLGLFTYEMGHIIAKMGQAIEYSNGDKIWCRYGQRHRDNGPAVEFSCGTKLWYRHGREATCVQLIGHMFQISNNMWIVEKN